jgi:hypothetical protein
VPPEAPPTTPETPKETPVKKIQKKDEETTDLRGISVQKIKGLYRGN